MLLQQEQSCHRSHAFHFEIVVAGKSGDKEQEQGEDEMVGVRPFNQAADRHQLMRTGGRMSSASCLSSTTTAGSSACALPTRLLLMEASSRLYRTLKP